MENKRNGIERISVRLNHVINRLMRLKINNLESDRNPECLLTTSRGLLGKLQQMSKQQPDQSIVSIIDLPNEDLPGPSQAAEGL